MTSRARLDHLLDRLTHTLPSVPGFETLSFFGSLADGTADGYSDLDLIVTTRNLSKARSEVLSILEEIDRVEFCWLFPPHRDEWNAIIVFANEGYYHRADLGLVSADARERTIAEEQTKLLVKEGGERLNRPASQSHAYAPPRGSVGHFLLAQFLGGGIRYAKARKRDQVTTCFRFVAAAAEWCLRAWYAELTGDHSLDRKLSTNEYKTLDSLLTPEQKEVVFRELDASSPQAMDRAVKTTLEQLLVHGRSLAVAKGEPLDESVFERMLSFLDRELRGRPGAFAE
ncbi:MAG: nucleotidyltransferase domain-containing protein [Armatimonadetes bacterium]|nr:nucleotidyltransferase domain-containing protein [Armatimonadota bacterium]